jgi:Ca2+-binding RTX toxin-like protein
VRPIALGVLVLGLVAASGAAGSPSIEQCTYDAGTKTVTLDLSVGPSHSGEFLRAGTAPGSALIFYDGSSHPCGDATDQNTVEVQVLGGPEVNHFTISERPIHHQGHDDRPLGGIHFDVQLGGQNEFDSDVLGIEGTKFAGNDMAVGTNGVSFEGTHTLDVTLHDPVSLIVLSGGRPADLITGQGGFGTGTPTSTALSVGGKGGPDDLTGGLGDDRLGALPHRPSIVRGGDGNDHLFGSGTLDGGPGNDRLFAFADDDTLLGGPGADVLTGNKGNDTLTGGPGQDVLSGNEADDTLYTRDGEADTLDGGNGSDQAQIDTGLDQVKKVEKFLP